MYFFRQSRLILFCLSLLKYNWQNFKIFKVYIVMKWYMYTFWNVYHKLIDISITSQLLFLFLIRMIKIYSQQIFSLQYSIVDYSHCSVYQLSITHSSCIYELSILWTTFFPFSSPLSPWKSPFYSVSKSLTSLDSVYKWHHTVFVFLCLVHFT